ncbi:MAG: hypothetical protein FWC26_05240 [Fibromonadales bacterium]|nr:hypothetical protein [Fibromonadales bacterium]
MKNNRLFLLAGLELVFVFTLSCSGDSNGGDDNKVSAVVSSSGTTTSSSASIERIPFSSSIEGIEIQSSV